MGTSLIPNACRSLALLLVLSSGAAAQATPVQGDAPDSQSHDQPLVQERQTAGVAASGTIGTVDVDPVEVVAGMFYNGATVRVSAVVPVDMGVAMVCRGEGHTLGLKKKGRVLGFLWMNTGDVKFQDVPPLYLLHASAPLEQLAAEPVLHRLSLGVDALAAVSDPGGDNASLFEELARLREKEGLWAVRPEAVEIHGGGSDPEAALATTHFELPPKAPPGEYEILVYALGGAQPQLVGEATVTIHQGGVAAAITTLATEHGLLYGILAVVVAIVVGLLTGVVFGLGSKGGH